MRPDSWARFRALARALTAGLLAHEIGEQAGAVFEGEGGHGNPVYEAEAIRLHFGYHGHHNTLGPPEDEQVVLTNQLVL